MQDKIMKTVYLHIGLHKTGTTSIQRACLTSPQILKQYGRRYYDGIFSNWNHREVAYSILREDLEWPARDKFVTSREEAFHQTRKKILSELQDTQYLIISAEAISYLRYQFEIDRLKKLFPKDVEIIPILFRREKTEWLESYTRQFIDLMGHSPSQKIDSTLNVNENSWLMQHEELENILKRNFSQLMVLDYGPAVVSVFSQAIGVAERLPELKINSTKNNFTKQKIFQIGFNKCGTTSLAQFFAGNGIRTAHYARGQLARRLYLNLNSGLPVLSGLEKFTAFTDMEDPHENIFGHRHFKEIYAEYPGAYYILNTRNKINWLNSRFHHRSGLLVKIMKNKFELSDKEIVRYWSLEWDLHHAQVLRFFQDRGNFLLYNVEADSPEKLVKFLQPDFHCNPKLWKHLNKTTYNPSIQYASR